MEGLTEILPHISGLPWVATFSLILFTLACSKGIDAILRWRKSRLEERQYDDGQTREGYKALVEELKNRIVKLEADFATVITELKDTRLAHAKCEVDQEKLRGEINVMKVKLDRLTDHDQNHQKHVEGLKEAVKQIDPTVNL